MSEHVNRAIQDAKYNELVEIEISADGGDENYQKIVLMATLDQASGGIQWTDANTAQTTVTAASSSPSDNYDDNQKLSLLHRHLQTKRWIFPMLNDHRRNELYDLAIYRATEKLSAQRQQQSNRKLPDSESTIHCLDIGSGTGLLAMLTTKHIRDKISSSSSSSFSNDAATTIQIQTTSLEMSNAMAQIATMTIDANNMSSQIQIREGHSCEILPLQPKAQICTSELLDSQLLGEGWIPAMRDAWERHLSPDAIVVPHSAKVYAQIVESNFLSKYWGPYKQQPSNYIRFPNNRSLNLCTSTNANDVLLGGDGDGGVLVPIHINELLDDIQFLSDPILALEVDVSSKESIPKPGMHSYTRQFIPIANGKAQAVIFWWDLSLFNDDESNTDVPIYNTHYNKGPWQDHWQHCAYIFTKLKDDCLKLEKDKPTTLLVCHHDTGISFDVVPMIKTEDDDNDSGKHVIPDAKRLRTEKELSKNTSEQGRAYISPPRAWQLNDKDRIAALKSGLQYALVKTGLDNAVVLDMSDFSLCAIIAALLGARQVTSIESGSGALPEMTARIAQISNGLPLEREDGDRESTFEMLRCHPERVSLDVLGGPSPVNIVVAEPYYEVLEGWHLQEALNYFYILRGLRNRRVLAAESGTSVVSIPSKAKVMACAIESTTIAGAYSKCQTRLRGFDHETINKYCQFHKQDLSIPTWQYNLVEMTEPFEIGTIDYERCELKDDYDATKPFARAGKCCGVLIWIEYGIRVSGENDKMSIISTMDRPCNQIIRMLSEVVQISKSNLEGMSVTCRARLTDIGSSNGGYLDVKVNQGQLSVK